MGDVDSDVVTPTPHMDGEGFRCFQEALKESRCYLEYGSGGSTVYAANVAKVPEIFSVESDRCWHEKVAKSIALPKKGVNLEYCDIGPVGQWGAPIDKSKVEYYWQYIVALLNNNVPDTILIDGRFRVATFLFSLLSARVGTKILFDDYLDRREYFVVEKFARIAATRGRMGVFTATSNFSLPEICARIAQYSVLPGA
jgi:hypothetical protein